MRLVLFCLLLLAYNQIASADPDSTTGSWNLIARGDFGFIIAHRPALEPLQEGHVRGFEVTFSKQYPGNEFWQRAYLYPDYGLTIAAFDLATNKLGFAIAVYPFIDFPLGKNGFSKLHFRYGMGLGYVQKKFDAVDNIKNAAVGSHVNGVIHLDLHYSGKLSERTAVEFGPALTHFSNGSYSLPNLGINIATFNLAIQHSFGNKIPIRKPEKTIPDLNSQIHVYTGGFFKKVYPPDGRSYFAMTLSGLWYKPVNLKSAFGFGGDIFYDNSIVPRIDIDGGDSKPINNFRFGLYGSYQLSAGHIGIIFNMGYYLYSAWESDGNVYHRIGLRYYFNKMFICMNLKTHYARADFIEVGAGIRIPRKKSK